MEKKKPKPRKQCIHGFNADYCYHCRLKLTTALLTIIEVLGVKKEDDDEQRTAVVDFTETTTLLPIHG